MTIEEEHAAMRRAIGFVTGLPAGYAVKALIAGLNESSHASVALREQVREALGLSKPSMIPTTECRDEIVKAARSHATDRALLRKIRSRLLDGDHLDELADDLIALFPMDGELSIVGGA